MIAPIAITPGEPAGIGPEILLRLAQEPLAAPLVAVANIQLLQKRAVECNIQIEIVSINNESLPAAHIPGQLPVLDVPVPQPVICGRLNPANADYVLNTLRIAVENCINGTFHAITTGPIHKGVINESGQKFSGHTEFLAQLCNAEPVMMLVADELRVALVTTHLALKDISQAISANHLENVIRILHTDLVRLFSIKHPRITVAGLNPHAGEGGYLGREEIDIIEPVLTRLKNGGLLLKGPLPADTLFTPPHLAECDAVLAMYHDQGLPVLKYAGFGRAVNVTLGLPIIRTSVDHGTALELAGTGTANISSLRHAFNLATVLSR
ncbi:MAG: 4-hydroxythreonine-4-phosphate dehydrogenase PdxA [Gammaproteobacteria bacterium]|nr:4-hydroxythreonine-4-phosphate dehydrogenase PdxA [Gammaproteobacteria bacterium]